MTIVGAEAYDDGSIVWCDMLVRHERDELQIEPIPKIAVFTFDGTKQRWTDRSSSRFAWIGDSQARNALTPHGLLQPLEPEDSDMADVVSEAWALTRAVQVVREAPADTVGGLLVTVFLDAHRGFVFRSATVVGPNSPTSDALTSSHDLSTLRGVLRTLLSNGDGLAYRIQDLGGYPSAFQISLATQSERAIVTYSLDTSGYAGRAYRVSNDKLIPLDGDPRND